MRAKRLGKTLNSHELSELLSPLRKLDNRTNLVYLAIEYVTMAVIVAPVVVFFEWRESWGLAWFWNIPVGILGIFFMGGLQHRLAGLGHEAAHYSLLKNRFWNDLISDLFCMFPIFATTHQYRLVHFAHHQFTNDWDLDPDLLNIGKSKLMDKFPMTRWQFVYQYFVRFFWPTVLLRYLWDIVYLAAFGKGVNPYVKMLSGDRPNELNLGMRWTSIAGVGYFFGLAGFLAYLNSIHASLLTLVLTPCVGWLVVALVIAIAPADAFFQSPVKELYSTKFTNALRLACYSFLLFIFAFLGHTTGRNWGNYFHMLWTLPLMTSFAYFMLLRDVYQHANADDGKLTNTRVFFCDPFTWWAVFVYGQDMHVPHHMYPAIPHYNLLKAHKILVDHNDEYAQHVVECHGTFSNRLGRPTILDVMEHGTFEDASNEASAPSAAPAVSTPAFEQHSELSTAV